MDELKVGQQVRVTFTNAIITKIDGNTVWIGSARFYGGGVFDVDQVEVLDDN